MKAFIIGSGSSGFAVFDYLSNKGYKCEFAKKEDINKIYFDEVYIENLLKDVDIAIISPGISYRIELVLQIKKRKIAFFGELEFGTMFLKNDIIAVTGTNGKTTTVSLIGYILKDCKAGSVLGGNIGVPVTSLIGKIKEEIVVLECSSFQLETAKKFKSHIAVILNITPDHLNRHKSMREYIRCKYKITKNQTEDDYLILNADDEILRKYPPKTKAKVFYFSIKNKVCGCYLKNNFIYFNDNEKEIRLVSISKIKLVGEHNLSNVLASVLSVFLQIGNAKILNNISSFHGVEHRIEYVCKIRGVEFYNDSKATNIASTLVALKSFENDINLILGGSDKGYNFDELFKNLPKNVKNIAIFGETCNIIALSANKFKFKNYHICENLEASTKLLFSLASSGDIILLSPACASFDFFSNYEERGNFFKTIVKGLRFNGSCFSCKNKKTQI